MTRSQGKEAVKEFTDGFGHISHNQVIVVNSLHIRPLVLFLSTRIVLSLQFDFILAEFTIVPPLPRWRRVTQYNSVKNP